MNLTPELAEVAPFTAKTDPDDANARVLELLRRDLFRNVVMLKTLSSSVNARAFACEDGPDYGVLVMRPTRDSHFDQRGYPQTKYVVLLTATRTAMLEPLLRYIPREFDLVFKLIDPPVRDYLEADLSLTPVTAYISYTRAPDAFPQPDARVRVSQDVPEECYPLFDAAGHSRAQMDEYFSDKRALCFSIFQQGQPIAACFTFPNFEQIHEIGGVYTVPKERRRGYGERIVSTALYELERRSRIPRYAVHKDNHASMRLADRVGLEPVVTMEHWLYMAEANPPSKQAGDSIQGRI